VLFLYVVSRRDKSWADTSDWVIIAFFPVVIMAMLLVAVVVFVGWVVSEVFIFFFGLDRRRVYGYDLSY
jgi:hypothetical protein